ncbi:MAG: YCF48-related protein, partial [bacterium]
MKFINIITVPYILSILFILSSTNIYSQSWFILNNGDHPDDINGIDFTDSNTGYAAGELGKIYKTTDGGNHWNQRLSVVTSAYLWTVSFADQETGWAAGSEGTIIKTTNGGENWVLQNSTTLSSIINVYFINSLTGWAAGHNGKVLRTTNGGINWVSLFTNTPSNIFNVYFIDPDTGWFASDAGVFKSVNGGNSWQRIFAMSSVYCSKFINSNTGWAGVRYGAIYKTTNSGLNWVQQVSTSPGSINFFKFINDNTGWAVGDNKTIWKTINAGDNWIIQESGITAVSDFRCADTYDESGSKIFIAGFKNFILSSTNGGISWTNRVLAGPGNSYFTSAD